MTVSVERAKINDAKEISGILKGAFRPSWERYGFCPAYEAPDEQIALWIQREDVYKIVANGRTAGAIFIKRVDAATSELNTIAVHPEDQSRGIGEAALRIVEGLYPETVAWTLQTPENDPVTRHFYEKLGYHHTGSQRMNDRLTLAEYRKTLPGLL